MSIDLSKVRSGRWFQLAIRRATGPLAIRAKVVQANNVFIFCPNDRNHAMLYEAIRRPVGEPGFRIGLHRFLTVFRKSVDGQITELAARKIQQARVAGLDGVDRRAGAQETGMSP